MLIEIFKMEAPPPPSTINPVRSSPLHARILTEIISYK